MNTKLQNGFVKIQAALKESARIWFKHLQSTLVDQDIYGFALYTDPDGFSVCEAVNTNQRYQSEIESRAPFSSKQDEAMALSSCKWEVGNWAYGSISGKHMSGPVPFDTDITSEELNNLYELAEESGLNFRRQMCDCAIKALQELNTENFFGTGPHRDGLLVFVTTMDSEDQEEVENKSASTLNKGALLDEFLDRNAWINL